MRPDEESAVVERAARAMFERRREHAGLRFDALPTWAQWVRDDYLADARAALVAAGVLVGPAAAPGAGDRYERLAAVARRAVAASPAGRADDRWDEVVDATSREDALLSAEDLELLGRSAVVRSLEPRQPTPWS